MTAGIPTQATDVGNAARFARDHAGLVRYCTKLGWLVWDGTRWRLDETGEVERLARKTVLGIYMEAADAEGWGEESRRKELSRHAVQSESKHRIEAMLDLAQSELPIASASGIFDRNHWLLNTGSGTVDLKKGQVHDHDPASLITKLAPTFYRSEAACPRWLTFLNRIMNGNLDMVEFLQRAVGYSLGGDTSEQVLFMLYGTGANGKSTFLETLRLVLGDYAMHTPAETLMVKTGGGIPNDVARLRGARFVTAVETEDGRRMAEGLVKQMTGGDTLTARFLHREFFEFRPEFKVWLATNHKPVIRGTDWAIWRRIRLVPFTVTIPLEERDKDLGRKLLEESVGILRWAVEGCLAWQKHGLKEPKAVLVATEQYRGEMDVLGAFIADRCVINPGLVGIGLYPAYKKWCEENGEDAVTGKAFGLRLQEKGFQRVNNSGHYRGLGLATEGR